MTWRSCARIGTLVDEERSLEQLHTAKGLSESEADVEGYKQ